MVIRRLTLRAAIARFRRGESGIVLVEALLVVPIIILLLAGIIEVGVMMMQWNQTVKAVQVGGRLAAVSDPLTSIAALDVQPTGYGQGDAQPYDPSLTVTCGAGTGIPCNPTELNRLLTGGDGVCGGNNASMRGMCDVAPQIRAENIRVTYSNSGLGYVGRPTGPVLNVKLEVRDVRFNFFALGAAMAVFGVSRGALTIPAHSVSLVSEDLSNCEGC